MSREEWEQIKQVFSSALSVPPEHRIEYLKEACGDRSELFATVSELLADHQDAFDTCSTRDGGPMPAFEEGLIIGDRFRITRFIARGGMGEVFEVFDERLRQRLALKTLRPDFLGDDEALERFQRELLVARGVAHESLCRVFDYVEHRVSRGRENARVVPCLTMELLEGQSLAELLQTRRPFPPGEALGLLRQIADGLDTLHKSGIVHRDLKPSNIMIVKRRNGTTRAVVTDFGLAKSADPETELFESRTDVLGGAPYFMAPEQLRHGGPSVEADVYALGLIADEMVTTRRAYSADSMHALYYAKLWETPAPPSERSESLPEHWSQAILRCIDPDPSRRFSHAGEFLKALESCQVSTPASLTAVPELAPERRPWRRAKRVGLWAALGTTVLGLLSAAVTLTIRPQATTVEVFDIENQTGSREYDYFCKGITNELLRRLSRLDEVHVIPLHSPRSNPPQRKLARFSLDGSLQGFQGQVRLAVMLTDNNDHRLMWSEDFDRKGIANPLSLQSEIAEGTVGAVHQRLLNHPEGPAQIAANLRWLLMPRSKMGGDPTSMNEAFDLYMRGRHLLEEASPQSAHAALDYFTRAIERDPDFALAHSALADACINNMDNSLTTDPVLLKTAQEHADRAVLSAPDLAEAHASMAAVQQSVWNWDASEASYRKALQLKPKFARAHLWYAGLIIQFGRLDEALREAKTAIELDPFDRATPRTYGIFLFLARHYGEAADMLSQAVAGKELPLARHNLGQVYAQIASVSEASKAAEYYRKAFDEAETVAAIERRESPNGIPRRPSISDRMFAVFYTQEGKLPEAEPYAKRVFEDVDAGRVSPVIGAWLYSLRGDSEKAIAFLERAEARRDRRLLYIKVNPYLDRLHSDQRFQALLKRLRL
jgi:serine/threonine protein kinase/Tfp pilus assembly protein PilF